MVRKKPTHPHHFIPATSLTDALVADIDGATASVLMQSMTVDASDEMGMIAEKMRQAATHGATIDINYDTRMTRFDRIVSHGIKNPVESILSDNTSVHTVGKPYRLNPYAGRSHCKFAVIDRQTVYYAGGVNFCHEGFSHHDYMLKTQSHALAAHLHHIAMLSRAQVVQPDTSWPLDNKNTVLFDGGKPGRSLILDTAIAIAGASRKAWYISQFAPAPRLAKALSGRIENIKYNRLGLFAKLTRYSLSQEDSQYHGSKWIHAKCLVVEHEDGRLEAVTGSHNFSQLGVSFGTQELALHTTDQELCAKLRDYIVNDVN